MNKTASGIKVALILTVVLGLQTRTVWGAAEDNQQGNTAPVEQIKEPSSDIVVPFKLQGGHVILSGRLGKLKERFIVDTGATETTVESFAAEFAGIKPTHEKAKEFSAINSKIRMQRAIAPEIAFGEFVAKDVPIRINKPRSFSLGPAGWLGVDILGKYVVSFDFEQSQLKLSRQLTAVPENSVVLPMKVSHNPYVTGIINATQSQTFMLDTGCFWPVSFSAKEAQLAGLTAGDNTPSADSKGKGKHFLVDVSVAVRQTQRLVVKTLDLGTIRLVDVDADVRPPVENTDGTNIIGLPFLQRFATAIFDFPQQRLILVRKQHPNQSATSDPGK